MARPVPNDAASLNILQNIEDLITHTNEKLDSVCSSMVSIEDAISNMVVTELQSQTKILSKILTSLSSTKKIKKSTEREKSSLNLSYNVIKFSKKSSEALVNVINAMTDFVKEAKGAKSKKVKEVAEGTLGAAEQLSRKSKSIQEAGEILKGLAKNLISFGLNMILAKPLLKVASASMKTLGKIVDRVIEIFSTFDKKNRKKVKEGADAMQSAAKDLVSFGLLMTLGIPVFVTGTIGTLMAAGMVWVVQKTLTEVIDPKKAKKMKKGADAMKDAGTDLLIFGASMTLFALLAIPAAVGMLLGVGLIYLLTLTLSLIPEKEVNRGTRALMFAGIAILALAGVTYLVGEMLSIESILMTGLLIGGLALVFGIAGKFSSAIMKGALVMLLASIPIIIIAGAMAIWKKSGVDWETVGQVGATVAMIGVEMALAGLASPVIALGSLAMILASVGIIALSFGLMMFKTVDWTEKDSGVLAKTITDVLAAMRGQSPGDGKGADFGEGIIGLAISLMNAGVLIVASVSIILLSIALAAFKAVGWTDDDRTLLGDTISGVLEALQNPGGSDRSMGQSILDTALGLISAGVLFVAGIAILIFSAALAAFKAVGWSDADNILLGNTITGVLNALSDKGEDKSMLAGILETALAMMSAGVLIVASVAILLFSAALAAFKAVGWTEEDNTLLGKTINGVLQTLGNPGGAGDTDSSIGVLGLIMALLSAGTIFIISGAVWLFGSALKQFKDVGWTEKDNKSLKSTIKGVTSVIDSLNDIDIDDDILDVIEDIADPLETFSKALQEFKKAEMSWDDVGILKGSIKGILTAFSAKNANKAVNLFGVFSGHIIDLADYVSDIDDLAKSFESIAESMTIIKDSINETDLAKLTQYRDIVHDLGVVMEKTQDKSLADIVGGISDAIANFNPFSSGGDDKEEDKSKVPVSSEQARMDNQSILEALDKLILEMQSIDSALRGVVTVESKNNLFG